MASLIRPFQLLQEDNPTRAACFHPFGDVYAIGSNSKTLNLYAYPTEEQLKIDPDHEFGPGEPELVFTFLKMHRGSIYCASFNSTGNLLATGSNDQTVRITRYNAQTQLPEGSENLLTMHSGTVREVCFTPGNLLSAGAGDFGIYATDVVKFKSSQRFQGHKSTVMSINYWNDDSHNFVSGSLDGSIKLWDLRAKSCVASFGTTSPGGDSGPGDQASPVGVVRVEQSGKLLVSGHRDGRCMLLELRAGRVLQLMHHHTGELRSISFSPKSYYLLSAGYDGLLRLMDLQGDLTRPLPGVELAELGDKIVQTSWHPTDYSFVSTCADGSFALWTMPAKSVVA